MDWVCGPQSHLQREKSLENMMNRRERLCIRNRERSENAELCHFIALIGLHSLINPKSVQIVRRIWPRSFGFDIGGRLSRGTSDSDRVPIVRVLMISPSDDKWLMLRKGLEVMNAFLRV
jgi:hypothetical protein